MDKLEKNTSWESCLKWRRSLRKEQKMCLEEISSIEESSTKQLLDQQETFSEELRQKEEQMKLQLPFNKEFSDSEEVTKFNQSLLTETRLWGGSSWTTLTFSVSASQLLSFPPTSSSNWLLILTWASLPTILLMYTSSLSLLFLLDHPTFLFHVFSHLMSGYLDSQ